MKKFTLAPYVRTGFLDGVLHFGFGSLGQLISEKEVQNCILDTAVFLKEPRHLEEVESFLNDSGHSTKTIRSTLDTLLKKFLIPEESYHQKDRHSRSLLFYSLSGAEVEGVQNKISSKTIAVVGCGGIGNVVSVLLATAGVEKFILVDKDHIELSNLSRQIMFRESDCDKYKTTVLGAALRERSSQVKITEIKDFLNEENIHLLNNADFILVSGDQGNVVDLINGFAIEHRIPFVNVGYIEDIAVWGPFVVPGKSGCCCCQNHLVSSNGLDKDQINKCKEINNAYQAPSTGPINMIAASFAALDIVKFFGEFGQIHSLNTRIGIWSHDLHIEKQNYTYNPSCRICGQKTE